VAALGVAGSSCAVGHDRPILPSNRSVAHRDLAARPGAAPPSSAPAPPLPGRPAPTASGPAASSASSHALAASGTAPPAATTITDPAGDQGAGPADADIRTVRLETVGDDVRVTVTLGARLPAKLATGEVMGIGVDFARGDAGESAYQLFADGEDDGWYAYLDTPTGFVPYPGTFDLAGDGVVFTVPWSALGGTRTGRTATFVDWSKRSVDRVRSSNDRAPDSGRVPFSA